MLVVFIRTIIIYVCLVIGMRLMGKRTIGELQPFEFTITLAIADLACMPMQDISVPLIYGLVPLFVMFLLHYLITIIAGKSIKFRRFLNGKPVIVINEQGIDYKAINSLNVNINDILESLRSQQFFSPEQVRYAVYETNGNLSVLENENGYTPSSIPVTIIVEGKLMETNFRYASVSKDDVIEYLDSKHLKQKDVLLMTIENTHYYIQPKGKPFFSEEVKND
ncbi:MAG: DUF421 domain-containing protein [Clostridia bacterium]|nr:DUF421 domain-containing protein [Clostridia bacterium]